MQKKIFFQSIDGIRLCGIWHLPDKSPNKAIILAHGITSNKDEDGIFPELADLLQEHGYAVFRFDFRGHGESDGNSVDMTVSGEIIDLTSVVNKVKDEGFKYIGLVGASFGGGTTVFYTSDYQEKLKCLCLWNPVLNYDHTFINPYLPWLVNKKEKINRELKVQGWSTIGSSNYKIGLKLWKEMRQKLPFEELKKIFIPTLIIHGDEDTYVPYEDSKKYVKNLRKGFLVTIEGAEHGFQDQSFAREKAKQETLKFFIKYL